MELFDDRVVLFESDEGAAPSAINENELPAYAANLKRLDEIEKEIANITYTQTDTELSERAELVKSALLNALRPFLKESRLAKLDHQRIPEHSRHRNQPLIPRR